MMNTRIGFGYDVHQLKEKEDLILGGISIPHSKGTVAHSDGDAVIHALCDALLGAAGLRDIGFHFPDTDPKWKNADSKLFLKHTVELLKMNGCSVGNVDITVCLQKPKIQDYIPDMKKILSSVMNIHPDQVSLKATTTEKLGFVGNEEGIAVYAVALIEKTLPDSV